MKALKAQLGWEFNDLVLDQKEPLQTAGGGPVYFSFYQTNVFCRHLLIFLDLLMAILFGFSPS